MRKVLVSIIGSALMVSAVTSPASADEVDHLYTIPNSPPIHTYVENWAESNTDSLPLSFSPFDERNSAQNRENAKNSFDTVLPICSSVGQIGCIESVRYSPDGFTWYTANLARNLEQREMAYGTYTGNNDNPWDMQLTSTWAADPSRGLFAASLPNEFTLANAPHGLGTDYLINATVTSKLANGVARIEGLEIEAVAGKVNGGNSTCDYWGIDNPGKSASYCYEPVDLPENLQLEVNVQLGSRINELSGWFDGRLSNPSIIFGNITSPGLVSIKGSPLKVNYFETQPIAKGHPLFSVPENIDQLQASGGGGTRGSSSPRQGLESFLKYESFVPAASAEIDTVWKISSWTRDVGISQCAANPGIQGIILTNATTYSPNPPTYDAQTGNLDFRVASSHYLPDGTTVNLGYYKLFIQERLASCLWGTTDISTATVSVREQTGTPNEAVTSVENINGWVLFTASNFHYSAPKISVGLPAGLAKLPATYKAKKTLVINGKTGSGQVVKVKVKGSCSVKAVKKTTIKKVGKKKVKTVTIISYKVKLGKKGKSCTVTQTSARSATQQGQKSVSIIKIN